MPDLPDPVGRVLAELQREPDAGIGARVFAVCWSQPGPDGATIKRGRTAPMTHEQAVRVKGILDGRFPHLKFWLCAARV